MIRKILSKRGFIITYEAIAIVIAFVGIFYVGYMAYTHNYLTTLEGIGDIEKFEKANLIVDVLFREAELPSNGYEKDYTKFLKNVSERYWGLSKMAGTFDPYTNITISKKFYFVNNSPIDVVSNVNISSPNLASNVVYDGNMYVKGRNLLIPIKTWKYSKVTNISEELIEGDILYFMTNASENDNSTPIINASSNITTNAIFLVNGVPFNVSLNAIPKTTNFTKVIELHEPNEIRLIDTTPNAKINLTIVYDKNYTIYVLKLRPYNISCYVEI